MSIVLFNSKPNTDSSVTFENGYSYIDYNAAYEGYDEFYFGFGPASSYGVSETLSTVTISTDFRKWSVTEATVGATNVQLLAIVAVGPTAPTGFKILNSSNTVLFDSGAITMRYAGSNTWEYGSINSTGSLTVPTDWLDKWDDIYEALAGQPLVTGARPGAYPTSDLGIGGLQRTVVVY